MAESGDQAGSPRASRRRSPGGTPLWTRRARAGACAWSAAGRPRRPGSPAARRPPARWRRLALARAGRPARAERDAAPVRAPQRRAGAERQGGQLLGLAAAHRQQPQLGRPSRAGTRPGRRRATRRGPRRPVPWVSAAAQPVRFRPARCRARCGRRRRRACAARRRSARRPATAPAARRRRRRSGRRCAVVRVTGSPCLGACRLSGVLAARAVAGREQFSGVRVLRVRSAPGRPGPHSTIRPVVHDRDVVADVAHHGQVVRDEQHRQAAARRCRSRTRLSTAPWIETSSAEVISSAMMHLRLRRPARGPGRPAGAARRTAAAGYGSRPVRRPGSTSSSSRATSARALRPRPVPGGHRLGDRRADRHARVQRGVRVLEHHLQRTAGRATGAGRLARRAGCARRSTGARPTAARARVDLPDPDSPTSPTTWPAGTVRLTPSTAVVPWRPVPYRTRDVLEAQLAHGPPPSRRSCHRVSACQQATRAGRSRGRTPAAGRLAAHSGRRRAGSAAANAQPGGSVGRVGRPARDDGQRHGRGRCPCPARRRAGPACRGGGRARAARRPAGPPRCGRRTSPAPGRTPRRPPRCRG